jgi:hypothetical protein
MIEVITAEFEKGFTGGMKHHAPVLPCPDAVWKRQNRNHERFVLNTQSERGSRFVLGVFRRSCDFSRF